MRLRLPVGPQSIVPVLWPTIHCTQESPRLLSRWWSRLFLVSQRDLLHHQDQEEAHGQDELLERELERHMQGCQGLIYSTQVVRQQVQETCGQKDTARKAAYKAQGFLAGG